jgi:hypothetical protein
MENCECGTCCKNCRLWKKLTTNSCYRSWTTPPTRTIGGRIPKGVVFRYDPKTDELEIKLPDVNGATRVLTYPRRFSEAQFKIMCCRFSFVTDIIPPTKNQPGTPSTFHGNHHFNPPWWNPPSGLFGNSRRTIIDPPFVVAVVRKLLEDNEDNPPLDTCGYCPNRMKCK